MADRSQLSTKDNRESKVYKPSNTRPRLSSDSSYVVLRDTAKLKKGIRKKKERRKAAKGQEKSVKGNKPGKLNPGHPHNKQECSGGLCIHRLLQFLVLFFSVCALTLVILMILGILGPDRCPACKNKGKMIVLLII